MYEGTTPADIVNRALDAIGRSDLIIGDLQEGTEAAKPALRAYGPAMRQLTRAAHWAFARKQAPLTLLADATGQTTGVGTAVPAPWTYEYEQPIDCLKVRYLPWNSNPIAPNPPTMTGLGQPPLNAVRLRPAPFLLTSDYNYPVVIGQPASWPEVPQWWGTEGEGPVQRNVILTNVPPQPQGDSPTIYPSLVYTALMIYPSQWDDLFSEALVAYLGQKLALPLAKNDKFGLAVRAELIKTAKQAITEARLTSANESGYPQTTDHLPDWIRGRNAGGGNYGGFGGFDGWNGPGGLWGGFDSCGFSDGSVY